MNENKVNFNSNFSLGLDVANQRRFYGFSYDYFENDKLKNQLHYETEITFRDTTSAGNYVFEIDRKQIYINNKTSYSQIEKIAETASRSIFPLLLKIKKNGQIDAIMNHDVIEKRWIDSRKNILEYYEGRKIEKIIKKIDTLLLNKDFLIKSIHQNWFSHLFFKPLYVSYTEKLRTKYICRSPVFGNHYIEYGVVQSVEEKYSDEDKIKINIDGIAIDERTVDEIQTGCTFSESRLSELDFPSLESKMNIDYLLYREDRSIFSVKGTFETKISEEKQEKIQVEIYHLTKSSSYRPKSDETQKANQKTFLSWQTAEDDDMIDISKPKWQVDTQQKPKIPKIPKELHEQIDLFVDVGPNVKTDPSFWDWLKSIFKKKYN